MPDTTPDLDAAKKALDLLSLHAPMTVEGRAAVEVLARALRELAVLEAGETRTEWEALTNILRHYLRKAAYVVGRPTADPLTEPHVIEEVGEGVLYAIDDLQRAGIDGWVRSVVRAWRAVQTTQMPTELTDLAVKLDALAHHHPMTDASRKGVDSAGETRTEWGVQWPGGGYVDDQGVARRYTYGWPGEDGGEARARDEAHQHRHDGARLVHRTVHLGPWTPVDPETEEA